MVLLSVGLSLGIVIDYFSWISLVFPLTIFFPLSCALAGYFFLDEGSNSQNINARIRRLAVSMVFHCN